MIHAENYEKFVHTKILYISSLIYEVMQKKRNSSPATKNRNYKSMSMPLVGIKVCILSFSYAGISLFFKSFNMFYQIKTLNFTYTYKKKIKGSTFSKTISFKMQCLYSF